MENSFFFVPTILLSIFISTIEISGLLIDMVLCCSKFWNPLSSKRFATSHSNNRNKLNLTIEWYENIFETMHFLNISFSWLGSILNINSHPYLVLPFILSTWIELRKERISSWVTHVDLLWMHNIGGSIIKGLIKGQVFSSTW